jgi:hypothetical protein
MDRHNGLDADVVLVWVRNDEYVAGTFFVEKAALTSGGLLHGGQGFGAGAPGFRRFSYASGTEHRAVILVEPGAEVI